MSYFTITGIAFGLAMDAMVVSVASGIYISKITPRHVFRLAFHFGLFQAIMPIIGWLIGNSFAAYITGWDHWVAFGLLFLIGGKMGFEGIKGDEQELSTDPSRGILLITLAIATSIDALAVGLSLAMLEVSIWLPSIIIGLITGGLSTLGVLFGNRIGNRWRRCATLFGGCVLILIGLKILVSHLS
ncbi:MAG: manganese efflux pump [Deltaproteobacteria bacterium]|nr:manganese efflux pump [Deltaproteobacteria bacterium]MBW1871385.1 manganese efflux pump [Deltaproteobacteria bacterium]